MDIAYAYIVMFFMHPIALVVTGIIVGCVISYRHWQYVKMKETRWVCAGVGIPSAFINRFIQEFYHDKQMEPGISAELFWVSSTFMVTAVLLVASMVVLMINAFSEYIAEQRAKEEPPPPQPLVVAEPPAPYVVKTTDEKIKEILEKNRK